VCGEYEDAILKLVTDHRFIPTCVGNTLIFE
jgi:hypothetical protein